MDGSSMEDNALTALCWSPECAPILAMQLAPELFDSVNYQRVCRKALDFVSRYGTPPRSHIRDLMEGELRRTDDNAKLLNRLMDDMEALARDLNPQYVLESLDRFLSIQYLKNSTMKALDALHRGELEEAEESLTNVNTSAPFDIGTWLHDPERALRFLNNEEVEFFSSGIKEFDARGATPARKTITVLIGPAKRGKSWFLHGIGKAGIIHHHSVLHITLENSEELACQRYVQTMFSMTRNQVSDLRVPVFQRDDQNELSGYSLDGLIQDDGSIKVPDVLNLENKPLVAERLRGLKQRPRLLVKEFATGRLTVSRLNTFLDMLDRTENFKPDLLIIDYPALMSLNSKEYRLDLGKLVVDIRGIAVERNLAAVVVAQSSKVGFMSRILSPSMIAEDFSQIGTADLIYTYSQTAEEKEKGLARLLVISRNSPDGYVVLISQSYAIGQFCIDSVYHSQHVESLLDSITAAPVVSVPGFPNPADYG